MASYPEHDKLRALGGDNQTVGDFIGWLGEQGFTICEWHNPSERYFQTRKGRDSLIADFFGIDEVALEQERRAILASLRSAESSP